MKWKQSIPLSITSALFGWEIQPATTVFSSHVKSASQPTSSVFLSRQISQPSSQPNKAIVFKSYSLCAVSYFHHQKEMVHELALEVAGLC